jgi:hypothetical protein
MKKLQPSIIIGLGGTGVKTILYLKKNLLEQAPEAVEKNLVRFLAIDIDELKGEAPSAGLFGNPIRLDPERNEFLHIVDRTEGNEARNIREISSWFPEEAYKYLPLTEGARQAKPVGRLGFFLAHDEIARWLNRLTDRLVTTEIQREFPGIRANELNVYIVSSICGGTGAGLFLDIAYELRYLQQQAQLPDKSRIKGLFALGDVYDSVSKRVLANTYASLREINWIQKEHAEYHPVYPGTIRNVIRKQAFDAIYLFSDKNKSDIEFSSPDDFARLCADFIFLDSGWDAQDGGDPLSAMMQSIRNNAEVYTMNSDADGTPRCYSSLGLCKIRFPAERVAELCAARLSHTIIDHHIIGRLDQSEIIEARNKVKDFIANEGLGCTDDSTDLPDRLVQKGIEGQGHIPFDTWITQSLSKAHNNDLEKIKSLQMSRFTQIITTLNEEISRYQKDMSDIIINDLQRFQRILQEEIKKMFQENLGVSFVARFIEELLENARLSRDYAQQEMKNLMGHEKRLSDMMDKQSRELANLLEKSFFDFLKSESRRAQLKDTYKAIRSNFINRIKILKMQAAVSFYDGVYDARQKIMEGGEGIIALLSKMSHDISLIQSFISNLSKTFKDAYENNKKIISSPFEILIYDNEKSSTLIEVYDEVYNESIRAKLFYEVLESIGGSIWNVRDYMDNQSGLRNQFMEVCRVIFEEQINRKTVAQRIQDARTSIINPIDYTPTLHTAYGISDYFCRLDNAAARFAEIRDSEQSMICIVGYTDSQDNAWNDLQRILREVTGRGGRSVPVSHSSDKHSILIYREYCGFPAYTLRRISAYHNSYVSEANLENTPPLQMLTKEQLEHINVPTHPVLSKFVVLAIEALILGVIITDEENYYMVTVDEWTRRKIAEKVQATGEHALIEDRTAGKERRMGSRFTEVVSRLNESLPEALRLSGSEERWKDQVQQQINQRKKKISQDMLCDLYEAMYFEGYAGTNAETINRETEICPAVAFILKRDFSLREQEIFRPQKRHSELLYSIYVDTVPE